MRKLRDRRRHSHKARNFAMGRFRFFPRGYLFMTVLLFFISVQWLMAPPVIFGVIAGAAMAAAPALFAGAAINWAVVGGMALLNGALAGASMLLQPKNLSAANRDRKITGTNPAAYLPIVYGRSRVGGTEVFFATGEFDYYQKVDTFGNVVATYNTMPSDYNSPPAGYRYQLITAEGQYLHKVIVLAGHQCDGIDAVYFDDYLVTWNSTTGALGMGTDSDGNQLDFTGYASLYFHNGSPTQVADAKLVAAQPALWDSTCTLSGLCYIYVVLTYNNSVFPRGVPNINVVLRGKQCYDPRTSTTAFTVNPALCLRDYLTDGMVGMNVPVAQINDPTFITAANHCDEIVSLASGGSESRYTCNGVMDTSQTPETIIGNILSAMQGYSYFSCGMFSVNAGVWRTPVTNPITESMARGPLAVQTSLSINDTFNAIQGQYIDPNYHYQSVDYPAVQSAAYQAQDGFVKWYDYTLPMTSSPTMAQRLAKMALLKTRQPTTITFQANLAAIQYAVGDIVPVTIPRYGWTNKYFEIVQFQFALDNDENGNPLLGVNLTMRETASWIYDWSTNEEQPISPLAYTNLSPVTAVLPPSNLQAYSGNAQLYIKNDGTVMSRVLLTWQPSNKATVQNGGYYNVQYKPSASATWKPTIQVTGDNSSVFIADVDDGISYDFRVQSVSVLGVQSDWAPFTNYIVLGKTAQPSSPTGFNVVVQPDGTRSFSWVNPPDLDFNGCLIGYSTNINATFAQMELLNNGTLTSSPYETNQLSSGTYSFGVVAVDTSGNQSAPVYIIGAILPNPRIAGAIAILNPDQIGWPGTLTNCHIDNNGWLEANSNVTWDSLTTWDAFNNWLAGAVTPITYVYGPYDIGIATQFTPLVSCVCLGTPTYKIQISQDGINWTGWQNINSVYSARYIKIQIQVDGPNPTLQSAQIILSGTPKTEIIANLNTATVHTSAGVFRAPLTKSYKVITSVNVMLLSVTAGWSAVVMDKNATSGPLINIYNGSNVLADCAVDIAVTGL